MSSKKNLVILGSTGSIGTQTLDVVDAFPNKFTVLGLSGGRKLALLKQQVKRYEPLMICVLTETDRHEMIDFLSQNKLTATVYSGPSGLVEMSQNTTADLVVVAIVGTASLAPTVAAITAGTNDCFSL